MWSIVRKTSLTCLAFALAAGYAPAHANGDPEDASTDRQADPFDGEWAIDATPDADTAADGQGPFGEAVLFHEGQFSAAVFAMFGFTPAGYTVAYDSGHAVFTATLSSSDRGSLVWSGRETATGIVGDLTWNHSDGITTHYTLSGERPD